jgi:perosamine synthetase
MGKAYWKLLFDDIGFNYRMTDAQAAVGIEQLKKLDGHNERRIELAGRLTERLKGIDGLTVPYVDPKGKHVYHVYAVQLEQSFPMSKEDFMWELYTVKGIKAWSHYMLVHQTDPYRAEGHAAGECPVAEELVGRHVTLPIHPRLTEEAIDYMAASIREVAGRRSAELV